MIPYDTYIMCLAGRDLPANAILTGYLHLGLLPIIRAHAANMAITDHISHGGFNERRVKIIKLIPGAGSICEVVAMTTADSDQEAACIIFQMWKKSRGHWKCISRTCQFYCFSLAKINKRYYAIGVVI